MRAMESRRSFLRWVSGLAIGGVILLLGGDLAESASAVQKTRASLINVTVYYSMMAQYTDLTEEYFVIQSPAVLQDLMNTAVIRHPSMAQMIQLMLTLLNGIPAKPSASLNDGDVIQFMPLSAGG